MSQATTLTRVFFPFDKHDFDGNFINQEFLPEEIANTKLFEPGTNQREASQKSYLREKWKDKYGY